MIKLIRATTKNQYVGIYLIEGKIRLMDTLCIISDRTYASAADADADADYHDTYARNYYDQLCAARAEGESK